MSPEQLSNDPLVRQAVHNLRFYKLLANASGHLMDDGNGQRITPDNNWPSNQDVWHVADIRVMKHDRSNSAKGIASDAEALEVLVRGSRDFIYVPIAVVQAGPLLTISQIGAPSHTPISWGRNYNQDGMRSQGMQEAPPARQR